MFISIEGGDGTGKSTITSLVYEKLKELGIPVIATRTPGGSSIGDKVREVMLNPNLCIEPIGRALLFLADMIQLSEELIVPAVEDGYTVITDRFFDSTIIYQVVTADGLSEEQEDIVFDVIEHLPEPDYIFVIDAKVETAMARVKRDQDGFGQDDVFESGSAELWGKRRQAFLDFAEAFSDDGVIVMDSEVLTAEEIAELIVDYVCLDKMTWFTA